IRRILGEEKIILIGHSYGAFLASIYSAEFPDNIEALILVAPAPIFKMPLDIPDMYESVRNDLPEDELENYDEFLNRYFDYKNIFKKSEEELVSLNNEFMKYFLMAHQKYDVAQPKESNTGGWMVHAMYLSSGREYDYTQEIAKVKVPTLIIHPGSDFIQNESARKMYLDIFPHAKYVVMEDAGHMAFYDKPDTFAKIVDDFLEENNLSNNDI
ncbi:MAG: alpha/beta fold hydrolase, partial [Bacillota bacterium]